MSAAFKRRGKKRPVSSQPRAYKPYRMRVPQVLVLVPLALILGFGGVFGFLAGEEMRSSKLQSAYLSQVAREATFETQVGAAQEFYTPSFGPYNQRLGYSYLPFFTKALEADGYRISSQVRVSPRYKQLVKNGIYPIYRPKVQAGLWLKDRGGQELYRSAFSAHVFPDYQSIPPLLVRTLLFIENRELLGLAPVTKNPVIEWDRFFYAALGQVARIVSPGLNLGGGSTLATQIEKFRFSPGGQTGGAMDKLRQIASGSLRVYMDGPDTTEARKRIVLDYLNSTPLSARAGFGEINSIGDGLWAWFGRDLNDAARTLMLDEDVTEDLYRKATVYREVLGLILAQRRPTYYLLTDRSALDNLTDFTLDKLASEGIISRPLRDATRAVSFHFLPEAPPPQPVDFLDQKAVNAMRTRLLSMLGLKNMYELDRLDLTATSTLDQPTQKGLTAFLRKMKDPQHVASVGLYGFRLLNPDNDLSKIHWSVLLYERGEGGNYLRVQADNIDGPLDMNDGVKLDLGSTAKLRTLVTYMEIVGELFRRYAGLSVDDLEELSAEAPDALTLWATTWLSGRPDATLEEMLSAAMDRKYSGNPGEVFFTGGGAHTFVNFEREEDYRSFDLREALRDSVNLVFVRLMRDIVNYTIAQGQQTKQELLSDPEHPARKDYLERYADREGKTFLNKYITEYQELDEDGIIARATSKAHKGATSRAILYRSIKPKADYAAFAAYMKKAVPVELDEARIRKLYAEYPPERYSLSDRGYITGINPIELWMIAYKAEHPKASRSKIISVSRPVRIESYAWLFHRNKKGAQDTRIRILLELDAFARIQQRWARLGYPFNKLVPSFATSIGSSADRPGALAELVGILVNDGVRKPMLRFENLHFAAQTPFETTFEPSGKRAERVLDPAIARIVRSAMMDVVENGTARRLRGAYLDETGRPLPIGAKTGTGDHRYDEYGPGHRLISSRVVNRTGTIAFYIGDRFFGTVTAHVAGEQAANYKFTSALSAQVLKALSPVLQPLIAAQKIKEEVGVNDAAPMEHAVPQVSSSSVQHMPAEHERREEAVEPEQDTSSAQAKPKPKAKLRPASDEDVMMDVLPR